MDLTSCMSPRDILARQRHALRIVVQEATDNEAKRLAHLWSLRRKYNAVATATKSQSNVHSQSSSAIVRESSLSIEMDTNKSSPRREGLAFGTQDSPESRQTIEDAHHRILANEILEKSVSLVDNSLNGDDNTSLGIDISLSSYHHDGNSSDGDGLFMESSSQEYNQDSSHLNPSRLQQPDHPRIKEFEERYNEERKLEQLRITRLFEDYAALKNAFFHNEVDLKQKQQQYIEKINDKVKVLQSSTTAILSYPNRFTGLETNQQHKFYDTMCKKFEKDAHKHAASLNVKEKPSTIQEQRKVIGLSLHYIYPTTTVNPCLTCDVFRCGVVNRMLRISR